MSPGNEHLSRCKCGLEAIVDTNHRYFHDLITNMGWRFDGTQWVCRECIAKSDEVPADMASRTCIKCRRVTKASSRYFRLAPRPFECESCQNCDEEPERLSPLPDNSHYKKGGIDPLQYVEAIGDAEYVGACILNVVKYVTRYRFKGSALDDLAKARDYVDRLIAHQKKKEATSPSPPE